MHNNARKTSESKENEAALNNAPNKLNILRDPIFSYENTGITEYAIYHKYIIPKKCVIINLADRPNSDLKGDVNFVVSFYRLKLNALSKEKDFGGVQETIEDYNSWMKYIIRAGGSNFGSSFDLFTVSKEDVEKMKAVLKEITTLVYPVKDVKARWRAFQYSDIWGNGVLVGDGAMGTELIERELHTSPAARLNKERADVIQKIHEANIEAGAQAILTNTFDANREALKKPFSSKSEYTQFLKELNSEDTQVVKELNLAGVEIARRACAGADILVFGRIGPSWREWDLSVPNGNEADIKKDLEFAFTEQAEILSEAKVDGIWIEGMACLEEAVIAVEAASENTDVPVICTMQFEATGQLGSIDFKTVNWRRGISDVVGKLTNAGASMIGANCGNVIEEMPLLAKRMREVTDLPLVFRMNTDRHPKRVRKEGKFKDVYHRSPEDFVEIMSQVAAAGGNLVGGCCGATPEHIAALRDRMK